MKKLTLPLALLLLGACSRGLHYHPYTPEYHPYTPEAYAPKSAGSVRMLFKEPTEPYTTIGMIDYDHYQPGFSSPSISDAMPVLQKKVAAVGGDALIIRDTKNGLGMERNIRIVGDVIRYEDQAQ